MGKGVQYLCIAIAMACLLTGSCDKGLNPPEFEVGHQEVKEGELLRILINATDKDGDDLRYCIDWGDGSSELWTGYYSSGETATISHTWNETGTYTIKVKAKDEGQVETEWVSLEVSMPHSRSIQISDSFMVLFGSIRDIEEDQRLGFRFLPVHLVNIGHTTEDGCYMVTMDEIEGGFPCCGYIKSDDFKGIITQSFICGIWLRGQ